MKRKSGCRAKCAAHGILHGSGGMRSAFFTNGRQAVRRVCLSVVALLAFVEAMPQMTSRHGVSRVDSGIAGGDTVQVITAKPIYCFRRRADLRKYSKMIRDLKKVYPIALVAKSKMAEMERELMDITDKKEQRAYIRRVERSIMAEYTPVLRHMTTSQGRMLVRLIDRETEYTSYQIVREFRGGFVAGFWQGIARIFGQNLKDEYDGEDRDKVLEQLILLYEADLL